MIFWHLSRNPKFRGEIAPSAPSSHNATARRYDSASLPFVVFGTLGSKVFFLMLNLTYFLKFQLTLLHCTHEKVRIQMIAVTVIC